MNDRRGQQVVAVLSSAVHNSHAVTARFPDEGQISS